MKQMLSILMLMISLLQHIQSQDLPKWVKTIDTKIDALQKAGHIEIKSQSEHFWENYPELQTILQDSIIASGFSYFNYEIERIAIATKPVSAPFYKGATWLSYFINQELVLVEKIYSNNNRMGSCGVIEIQEKVYFKNDKPLFVIGQETPFECYNTMIDTNTLVTLGQYLNKTRNDIGFNAFLDEMEQYKLAVGNLDSTSSSSVSLFIVDLNAITQDYELIWLKMNIGKPRRPNKDEQIPSGFPIKKKRIADQFLIITFCDLESRAIPNDMNWYFRKK